jgi:hypothetical protein
MLKFVAIFTLSMLSACALPSACAPKAPTRLSDYPDIPGVPLFKEQVDAVVAQMEAITKTPLKGRFVLHMATDLSDDLVKYMHNDGPRYVLGLVRFGCQRPEVSVSWRHVDTSAPTRVVGNTALPHELMHLALHLQGRHEEKHNHQAEVWTLVPGPLGND